MRADLQSHIDELLSQYRVMTDRMAQLRADLAALTATAISQDGLVSATVGAQGQLVGLRLAPDALLRLDAQTLSAKVLRVADAAADQTRGQVQEIVAEHVPVQLRGLAGTAGAGLHLGALPIGDPTDLGRLMGGPA